MNFNDECVFLCLFGYFFTIYPFYTFYFVCRSSVLFSGIKKVFEGRSRFSKRLAFRGKSHILTRESFWFPKIVQNFVCFQLFLYVYFVYPFLCFYWTDEKNKWTFVCFLLSSNMSTVFVKWNHIVTIRLLFHLAVNVHVVYIGHSLIVYLPCLIECWWYYFFLKM